ncbi:MAG: metal ABC transporter permease, partial [Magnetospirillum sp.]|nr:metal ABC transporter permease [Magnetospirillum sp.]
MRRRDPSAWDKARGRGPSADWTTIRTLIPYLWPPGEPGLRLRVVVSMLFLVAAKGIGVGVPLLYKQAVDRLSIQPVTLPLALLLAYGLARILGGTFGELRDIVFVKVAQRAIRSVGLGVFQHLHRLGLRFHLDRQTGGVSRAIERGTKGIEFLLQFMLFNILPTFLEIGLVTAVLWSLYDSTYALITAATIALYIAFTLGVTEWRTKY